MKVKRNSLVLIGLLFALVIRVGYASTQEMPNNYELIAANEQLCLYLNRETTEVAIQHNVSNDIWYSNPPDRRTDKETLSIAYYNPSDELKRMNNYNDSIAYSQFEIEEIENGVRISYLFGPEWWDDDWLPLMIPQDRFENEILPRLSDQDRDWLRGKYKLIGFEEAGLDYERIPITDLPNKAQQFQNYTVVSPGKTLSNRDKQTLILLLIDTVDAANDDFDGRDKLRFEHIDQLIKQPAYVIDNTTRPWDRTRIINIMKEIEYTPYEIAKDHEANKIKPPILNVEVFSITVEYVLDGESLVVRVPMKDIEYPVQVVPNERYITGVSSSFRPTKRGEVFDRFGQIGGTLVNFPLYSISVLNHFGASFAGSNGYILIPDGSGAIINTQDTTSNYQYARDMYGRDNTVFYGLGEGESYIPPMNRYVQEDLYMPIFGLKEGDKAFFVVIEEGSGMSRIRANTASSVNPYSSVSSEFVLIPYGNIKLTETEQASRATGQIKAYANELPNEDIVVRYTFLSGADANYVGMAKVYRNYLAERYSLDKTDKRNTDIPFYLELTGAVPIKRSIMGIPYIVATPLTTYQQAIDIVTKLNSEQVRNIQLNYNGWRQGGLYPGYPDTVNLEKALGTDGDFRELNSYLEANEFGFYPNIHFLNAYHNKYGKLEVDRDVAQGLNRQPVTRILDNVTFDVVYVLSPGRLDGLLDQFLNDYMQLGVHGIALADIGKQIDSDFAKGSQISRGDSLLLMTEAMSKLKNEADLDLMVNKANVYAVPYASHVVNMPLTSTGYNFVSTSVPFYQMVLHGYVNYSGAPLNHYPDYNLAVLKSVEVGAAPYFSWMYAPGTTVKGTNYNYLFSNYYSYWFDKAVGTYKEMNDVLSQVQGQHMIDHQPLDVDVYLTIYENGLAVIVNYGSETFEYNGISVEGKSFKLIGEHSEHS